MKTKHAPATPLPILTGPVPFGASRFELQGDNRQIAVFRSVDDAREVRHRANTYPKLVEALREIRKLGLPTGTRPFVDGPIIADHVLRSLGEDA